MDKVYPAIYGQQNYPDKLGTSPSATIASDGCFVTSFAMKAGYYGHTITPPELNKLFTNFNGKPIYINGDLLPDNALAQVFDDVKYVKTFDYEPIPTDLNNIKTLLSDKATTLTIRINRGNGDLHFVEAVSCDGVSLHIANPWTGQIEDFVKNYGNPITAYLHVIVYTGTVPANQPSLAVDPTSSPLAQRFNQAITKASNFDVVAEYLNISQDQRVTTAAGLIVVERIKQLQKDLQGDDERIKELTQAKPEQTTPQTVVTTTTTVTPPTPTVGTVPEAQVITFKDGTTPMASNSANPVLKNVPDTLELQKSTFLDKIWRTLVFWLG